MRATSHRRMDKIQAASRRLLLAAAALLPTIGFAGHAAAQAAPPDPSAIAAGRGIWTSKANCQICHGWAGDGEKMDNQMPDGASLRDTIMDREQIIETIKCGKPNLGMPSFDRTAYTANNKCYGMTKADLAKTGMVLADAVAPLTDREITNVVDFLYAKIIGKGEVTRASCTLLYDREADICKGLP